ncbi:MAG: hypothetical protein LBS36_02335, partial [Oscillospiraceae bacterium]|nr:hypothetical protein [Oscillospiraceae bacterium]
ILHPDITVKQVYLKEYQEEFISNYEVMRWDNQEVYDQMLAACKEKGVEVLQALPADPWLFGDFTVQFFNTKPHREKKVGENENAVGTKLTVRSYSAFLAADINNIVGTEDEIAPEIGRVDILKLGHHGYTFSTTKKFVETLSPKISIVTNDRPASRVNGNSLLALLDAGSAIYTTGEHDGVIANLTGETIVLTENIHN